MAMQGENKAAQLHHSEEHAHHWVLDQRSLGVCKHCGAVKQFAGYVGLQPGPFGLAKSKPASGTSDLPPGHEAGDR
jgi:hypothetical protein